MNSARRANLFCFWLCGNLLSQRSYFLQSTTAVDCRCLWKLTVRSREETKRMGSKILGIVCFAPAEVMLAPAALRL
jgi:hypothetical protein